MSYFDSTGVNVPTYDEMLVVVKAAMRAKWGENIAVDDPDSNMGKQAAILAELASDVLQDQAATVNGLLPSTSIGALLSELVKFNGIERNGVEYSTATVTCTALATGCTIPAGSLVSTDDGVTFATDEELVLSASASDDVDVTATEAGALVADAGTITTISTPVYGWDSVTNAVAATPGRSDETDPALRARRARAARGVGLHHQSAIKRAIENIEGVTAALLEIDTSLDNPLRLIVAGGADQDIADVLFGVYAANAGAGSAAAGIGTRGATAVECTDEGQTGYVYFDRPTTRPIYVAVNTRKRASQYPSNGDALIKAAIVDLFAGDLEINDVAVEGFNLGDDIYASKIMAATAAVPGHDVVSVYVGIAASPTATLVELDTDELASTSTDLITVVGV